MHKPNGNISVGGGTPRKDVQGRGYSPWERKIDTWTKREKNFPPPRPTQLLASNSALLYGELQASGGSKAPSEPSKQL